MSEHNANAALAATARLRIMAEPVEDAQLMTFSERQYRAREARGLYVAGLVVDTVETQINTIARTLGTVETASGAALDALCRIPIRPAGMTDEEVRQQFVNRQVDREFRDFREGDRKYRLTAHEIAQQDGFPDT